MKCNECMYFFYSTHPFQECSQCWGYTSKCIEVVPAKDSNTRHWLANTPL
jgi:hypothetical protein